MIPYANLDEDQLEKLRHMERELNVVLVAYPNTRESQGSRFLYDAANDF
jgi:hypothetical protein